MDIGALDTLLKDKISEDFLSIALACNSSGTSLYLALKQHVQCYTITSRPGTRCLLYEKWSLNGNRSEGENYKTRQFSPDLTGGSAVCINLH